MTHYELRYDDDGRLDELVGRGHVHLERMDEGAWCLILDCDDGSRVMLDLSAARRSRTKVEGLVVEESGPCDR